MSGNQRISKRLAGAQELGKKRKIVKGCAQCEELMETIQRLRAEVESLRGMVIMGGRGDY